MPDVIRDETRQRRLMSCNRCATTGEYVLVPGDVLRKFWYQHCEKCDETTQHTDEGVKPQVDQ